LSSFLEETANVRTRRYQWEFLKDGIGRNIITYKMENRAFRVRAFVHVCGRACMRACVSVFVCMYVCYIVHLCSSL